MDTRHAAVWGSLLLFAAGCARGCSKPEPPVLTPHRAAITQIAKDGIDFSVEIGARNPNRIDLSARTLTAHVVLDGQVDLGTATVTRALTIPADQEVELAVPVTVQWKDLAALTALALANRDVPFAIDGVVNVGGETLNVDVPYRLNGTITRRELIDATMRSLPALPQVP